MDSSLLLLPLARQRLLQALALGISPQALTDSLAPVLACNPLLSLAAETSSVSAEPEPAAVSSEWTSKEDELLKSLIGEFGTSKWSRIAAKMGSKTNRQCRRRWQAIMNSMGNKGSWTAEEDAKLLEGHRRFGNRWTDIARLVPGRTDNAVKNRFAALVAKGEGVRTPKVQRWSDVCVVPKGTPALEKADYVSPPASPSTSSSSSKRKEPGSDASSPAVKRSRASLALDLNFAPESEGCLGWLASDSEPEMSEGSCSHTEDSCGFDLNSPASE